MTYADISASLCNLFCLSLVLRVAISIFIFGVSQRVAGLQGATVWSHMYPKVGQVQLNIVISCTSVSEI